MQPDPTMGHLLISACRSDQTAADATFGVDPSSVVHNGALTYLLDQVLRQHLGETWVSEMQALESEMQAEGFNQVPQLEGPPSMINGYPFA